MIKRKNMLVGLMLCGAIALAGGVGAMMNGVSVGDTCVTVSAETAFAETTTAVSNIHLRNKRLLLFLETCDYTDTEATTPASASYSDYDFLDKVQIYVGDTCVTLREALATGGDTNVYYNVWGESKSVSLQLDGDSYTAANVTKIVIPAGTQFPAYAYTNNGGDAVAYTTKVTYVFTNNEMANPDWSITWVRSIDYSGMTFTQTNTVASVETYVNSKLKIALSVSDYANAPNNEAVYTSADQFKALNTLTNIKVNGTPLKDITDPKNAAHLQMWGQPAFWVNIPEPAVGTTVVIPAGTQFPSAEFIFNDVATCYVTTADCAYKYDGTAWTMDYDSLTFTDTATNISLVQWVNNQRLMIQLGENDYGTSVENKVNVNVPAGKLAAMNMLEKVFVNGTSLKDLGVTSADLNHWTYWGRVSVALNGIEVKTITVEEGCQFPSMAFMESGALTRYENSASVTYYAVGEAVDGVLTCKTGASVTFDGGEPVQAYVGMPIPADGIPATPTKEVADGYQATFLGWYNGEEKWDLDAPVTGDLALVAKFDVTAIEYTVTFVADGATVDTATYTVENTAVTAPAVPEKEGYTGVWETYTLTTGDITVNAVYTEIPVEDDETSSDNTSDDETSAGDSTSENNGSSEEEPIQSDTALPEEKPVQSDSALPDDTGSSSDKASSLVAGCFGSIGGMAIGMTMLGAAAVAVLKKKED